MVLAVVAGEVYILLDGSDVSSYRVNTEEARGKVSSQSFKNNLAV